MGIKYKGHKILESEIYCLKGIKASRIEATERRTFVHEVTGDTLHDANKLILVREIGQNNRIMRKYQTKYVKVGDLENRPGVSGPEPIAKGFAYADGLIARDSNDKDMVFGDPVWIIGAQLPTTGNPFVGDLLDEDGANEELIIDQLIIQAVNLRSKKLFTFTQDNLNDFCWVPYGQYMRDGGYYTRVGGQYQEKRNGKFKSLNIVQGDDPSDTTIGKYGVENRLKNLETMKDEARDEFVFRRLEIQRRFCLEIQHGVWPPPEAETLPSSPVYIMFSDDETNAIRERLQQSGPKLPTRKVCIDWFQS